MKNLLNKWKALTDKQKGLTLIFIPLLFIFIVGLIHAPGFTLVMTTIAAVIASIVAGCIYLGM